MTENNDKELIINRRETLADVFASLFLSKSGGSLAFLKIILAVITIGWLGDSLLPFINGAALLWHQSDSAKNLNFTDDVYRLGFAFGFFSIYIIILFIFRLHKEKALEYEIHGSVAHRGLILSLSPYSDFSKKRNLEQLEIEIDNKTLDIEEFFNTSNWGQIAFAVAHHSYLLQYCWIFTTEDSSKQYPVAEKLVNYISESFGGRRIICINVKLKNENDLSEMAHKVSTVYRSLEDIESLLKPRDVISNYTGGTAAMTGGMIMATLNENRTIEYLNQKYRGKLSKEMLGRIDENLAIVSSKTNLAATEKLN